MYCTVLYCTTPYCIDHDKSEQSCTPPPKPTPTTTLAGCLLTVQNGLVNMLKVKPASHSPSFTFSVTQTLSRALPQVKEWPVHLLSPSLQSYSSPLPSHPGLATKQN